MNFKFSLIAFAIFISLSSVSTEAQKSFDILTSNKIIGAWRINHAESDNPLLKMQSVLQNELTEKTGEKTINAKDETLPTMSVSLVPPKTLILAGEDESSITINEAFSDIIFTRTITTDGKMRDGELQNGAKFSLLGLQNADFLKVETVSPRGNKMIETYGLANEGKKLVVMIRFEDAEAKEILSLRRVYDRTVLDIFSTNTEDFQ